MNFGPWLLRGDSPPFTTAARRFVRMSILALYMTPACTLLLQEAGTEASRQSPEVGGNAISSKNA